MKVSTGMNAKESQRNNRPAKHLLHNMNGQGEFKVYFLQEALLLQGVFDFVFGVQNAGEIVDCNLHIERFDKLVDPAGFLFHSLQHVFQHLFDFGFVGFLEFWRIQNLNCRTEAKNPVKGFLELI